MDQVSRRDKRAVGWGGRRTTQVIQLTWEWWGVGGPRAFGGWLGEGVGMIKKHPAFNARWRVAARCGGAGGRIGRKIPSKENAA